MTSMKYAIVCIACAAFTDIANSAFGMSYWSAYAIAVVCLFIAGYTARTVRNVRGRN